MFTQVATSFDVGNKSIDGVLKKVSGAGLIYHLMVDDYYWGQLNYSENFGWRFSSNKYELSHLSEYFGEMVAVALESE